MLSRLQRSVAALDAPQRLAGAAAIALMVTLVFPWYQKSVVVAGRLTSQNQNAFQVFSFVEAAVLLVALGVLVLLFMRGERRGFHLPGGDGTVVLAAGAWAAFLLVWRVFDRPHITGANGNVGITWGFLFAFLAAAGLTAAGLRLRQAHVPEPPNPAADEPDWNLPVRRRPVSEERRERPRTATAPTPTPTRAPVQPVDPPEFLPPDEHR